MPAYVPLCLLSSGTFLPYPFFPQCVHNIITSTVTVSNDRSFLTILCSYLPLCASQGIYSVQPKDYLSDKRDVSLYICIREARVAYYGICRELTSFLFEQRRYFAPTNNNASTFQILLFSNFFFRPIRHSSSCVRLHGILPSIETRSYTSLTLTYCFPVCMFFFVCVCVPLKKKREVILIPLLFSLVIFMKHGIQSSSFYTASLLHCTSYRE